MGQISRSLFPTCGMEMIERVGLRGANFWMVVISEESSILGTLIMIAVLKKADLRVRRRIIRITVLKDLLCNEKRTVRENKTHRFRMGRDAFKNRP